jgi:sugar phosphate isomerase/epimerase
MKKLDLGFIQGRMTSTPSKNILQYFPQKNWKSEFFYAKKNKFQFIEYFGERKFNKKNPFWSSKGLKKINSLVKTYNLFNYSFCDDYFINHSFLRFKKFKNYTESIVNNLSSLKIKIYVLALFEKSEINKKNLINFVEKIKYLSQKLEKKKIKLALEINLDNKNIKKLINLVNSKNLFLVYDTGNRLKKGNLQYEDIIELKKFICHIHLKDKNWKGQNVVLGSGKVNFKKIFKALKKIKYQGKYTFETNRGEEPIETMRNNRKIILDLNNSLNVK